MTSIEDPRPRQQVVWEVEVEDEVLARLGGVRMGGFQNLNVCSLGFMKILIWSDKVGEVKEVKSEVSVKSEVGVASVLRCSSACLWG
jgi:hypothetical protein